MGEVEREERGGGIDREVERSLLTEKRMRCLRYDGEAGGDAEAHEVAARVVGARAGVVQLAGHERQRRIGAVDVVARRSKGVERGLGALGGAEKRRVMRIVGALR